uniref:Anaphase-promoting complex subunit 4 WD40 domain-containing protein n=1 Tax=Aureoumbra lagunensis TaxID=44058 RepID=A0A7S3JVG8_9STRA|eukprot:CAMPEP_0197289504 /NCGR_PEP_ID=MMETSP0890-20130614/6784_1 /TAXON_ID=44058 ORGANISM="Aureoumbra lagunensis, Strain CCMP1510" /NCGR_SAMPLE_ID=MMETSP0890 /ASSEMBLY_ACC=CAM_ASM_000533 /LENGTH=422 /DNA_ID=CAMNT_0042760977 /DNA_START=33 /DNA_END=1301 /DNA_ORIENTATION=+
MTENIAQNLAEMEVDDDLLVDDDNEVLVEDEFDGELAPADDDDDDDVSDEEDEIRDLSALKLTAHTDSVYAVALGQSLDGRLLALTGGGDDLGRLTHVGNSCIELTGHGDSVSSVAFSHDGALCATGGYDGVVQIWETTGSLTKRIEGPGDVEWLRFHPRGDVILAGSGDGTVWLWQARTGECLRVFVGHEGAVSCGEFTSDGNGIVTGSADATVRSWAPKKGTCKHTFANLPGAIIQLAVKSITEPDIIAAALDAPKALLFHLKSKQIITNLDLPIAQDDTRIATFVALAPAISWAVVGDDAGALTLFDYSHGDPATIRHVWTFQDSPIVQAIWHPSQPRLTVATADGFIRHLDARVGGDPLYELSGHTDLLLALDVHWGPHDYAQSEVHTVLSAGDDRIPRIFRARFDQSTQHWVVLSSL